VVDDIIAGDLLTEEIDGVIEERRMRHKQLTYIYTYPLRRNSRLGCECRERKEAFSKPT
jgi:hypothetical protein